MAEGSALETTAGSGEPVEKLLLLIAQNYDAIVRHVNKYFGHPGFGEEIYSRLIRRTEQGGGLARAVRGQGSGDRPEGIRSLEALMWNQVKFLEMEAAKKPSQPPQTRLIAASSGSMANKRGPEEQVIERELAAAAERVLNWSLARTCLLALESLVDESALENLKANLTELHDMGLLDSADWNDDQFCVLIGLLAAVSTRGSLDRGKDKRVSRVEMVRRLRSMVLGVEKTYGSTKQQEHVVREKYQKLYPGVHELLDELLKTYHDEADPGEREGT